MRLGAQLFPRTVVRQLRGGTITKAVVGVAQIRTVVVRVPIGQADGFTKLLGDAGNAVVSGQVSTGFFEGISIVPVAMNSV